MTHECLSPWLICNGIESVMRVGSKRSSCLAHWGHMGRSVADMHGCVCEGYFFGDIKSRAHTVLDVQIMPLLDTRCRILKFHIYSTRQLWLGDRDKHGVAKKIKTVQNEMIR